ncbi:MAG: sulfatase [Spirochaetales bacterium]|nr:sulfatase [Spirochaetales bacterium]
MKHSNPVNILFLHSHNTGRYIQPYGHRVPTPNLQKLAEEGVVFRNAFSAAPTCSPSRGSFLSGMWAHSCGMLGLAHRGFAMQDYSLHCAQYLKTQGYTTALAGVEHTASDTEAVGYSKILTGADPNYPGQEEALDTAEAAVNFLNDPPNSPFFLSVGLAETHIPFPDPEPAKYPSEDHRYNRPPMPLPDTEVTRRNMAAFTASARIMDEKYGLVLDALERSGLSENTIVFCFSDHGLQFPRCMCNLTDHGIAVYCIARGPGGFTGGKVIDNMISLIDLLPTAYDVAGIKAPSHIQGISLKPLINGETNSHRDYIFAESNFHASYEPMRCVRTDTRKYILRYDGRSKPVLPNMDDGPSKDLLLQHGWADSHRDQEMLYDLIFDPAETNNLARSPEYTEIRAQLSDRLREWMASTLDPILETGHIAPPKGSRINDADGLSPKEPQIEQN